MIFDANLLQSRRDVYIYQFHWAQTILRTDYTYIYALYIGSVNVAREQESLYLYDEFHLESFEMAEAPRIVVKIEKEGKKDRHREYLSNGLRCVVGGCDARAYQQAFVLSTYGNFFPSFFFFCKVRCTYPTTK